MIDDIGKAIRTYRKERGLSQTQLGNVLGISTSYVQQLELSKKTNPSHLIKIKINTILEAKIYDVDVKPNATLYVKDIKQFSTDELLSELKRRIEGEDNE